MWLERSQINLFVNPSFGANTCQHKVWKNHPLTPPIQIKTKVDQHVETPFWLSTPKSQKYHQHFIGMKFVFLQTGYN